MTGNKTRLTVAIPTKNRPEYLRQSLASVMQQDFNDKKIVVIDNASDVEIKPVVDEIGKREVEYVRNENDLGIIGNWNKAIELCQTPFLSIFHDDDVMLPGFLSKSILALEKNPTAMMSYTQANKVDPQLNYISIWSELFPNEGLIRGSDYLMYSIKKGCCVTIAPTVVLRRNVFEKVGLFTDELCFNSFDFNMWIKIADKFDLVFIKEVLVNYRLHEKQMSKEHWFTKGYPTGRLATMMELIKAVSLMMQKEELKTDTQKQIFLREKIAKFDKLAAGYARNLIPGL
ncbi:glycosyltransferase family 2 protein [Candidatus Collierbacteria bacterium]|nr:glycosyltransferase family 2 protein [Candidatus Collierbacteria bacterium]